MTVPTPTISPVVVTNEVDMSGGNAQSRANTMVQLERTGVFDESARLMIIESLKQSIVSSIESSISEVVKEVRSDREQIKKLREHVTELTSIVTTTASEMFIKQAAPNRRVKEIQKKLCLLPALFNDQFMLKILPRVVIGFLVNNIQDGAVFHDLESRGIDLFGILYLSLQPNEKKKEKFNSDVGRFYSKFRYGLLMSSFLAMQTNAFNTFKEENIQSGVLDSISGTEEKSSTIGSSVSAMLQPFWLQPGYVLSEHCTLVAKKQEKRGGTEVIDDSQQVGESSQTNVESDCTDIPESSNSSGKQKAARTGPLTQDEIASEAALMVYKVITSILTRSRYASRIQLFHDLMYIFVGWDQHGAPVDQKTLSVQWEIPLTTRDVDYVDSIPKTKVVRPQDHCLNLGQELDKADLDNCVHLETLISKHPELSLIIEHDVIVDGNVELLRYRVNLIEVVCRSLAAYTTLESAAKGKDVLRADRQCLKGIVVLSLALRKLMEKAVLDLNNQREVPWRSNLCVKGKRGRPKRSTTTSPLPTSAARRYKFDVVNGISLETLFTAPSKQKEALNQMILNLTAEEFAAKSINRNGRVRRNRFNGADDMSGNQAGRIVADETQGVFKF